MFYPFSINFQYQSYTYTHTNTHTCSPHLPGLPQPSVLRVQGVKDTHDLAPLTFLAVPDFQMQSPEFKPSIAPPQKKRKKKKSPGNKN
jgi:hypothetical protein